MSAWMTTVNHKCQMKMSTSTEGSDDNCSESEIDDIDDETSVICDDFDASNSSLRAKSGTVWEALKTNQSA